jgi:hypothetical protein
MGKSNYTQNSKSLINVNFMTLILSLLINFILFSSINTESIKNIFLNYTNFEEAALHILGDGEMADSCLTHNQYIKLIKSLENEFPEKLQLVEIGKTYNNNTLYALKFKQNLESNISKSNKAILFTGMHHGREPTSMMMNLYVLLKLLHMDLIHNDKVSELLPLVNVYFIPMINVDGYILNNENYFQQRSNYMIRKNRNADSKLFYQCKDSEDFDRKSVGVDLNRNYGYKFGHDNRGSSNYPCNDDYRGPHPFSEKETIAIRDFIENHPEIKIAFNYHSYGNLLITPFNYANYTESTLNLFMNFTQFKTMYEEFHDEGHFPEGNKEGNGMETISYSANGEASDWMLGEKKILAFSPELGIKTPESETFYPSRKTLFQILSKNLNSAIYALTRAAFTLQFKNLNNNYIECSLSNLFKHKFLEKDEEEIKEEKLCQKNFLQFSSQIQIYNNAFGDFNGKILFEVEIDTEFMEYYILKLNTGHKHREFNDEKNLRDPQSLNNLNLNTTILIDERNITEMPGIKKAKTQFKVEYIPSFDHQILELKFYVNQTNLEKLLFKNQLIFIKRLDQGNHTEYFKNMGLKFNIPQHILKLSQFNKFEMAKPGPNDGTRTDSKIRQYSKIIVLSLLIGLFLVVFVIMTKLRMYYSQPHVDDSIDSSRASRNRTDSNMLSSRNNTNIYVELENSRDF